MLKTKIASLSLAFFALALCSCTEDNAPLTEATGARSQLLDETISTRSIDTDSIIPLQENDSLKKLKVLVTTNKARQAKILATGNTDDFFTENMYAIRELPLTIKVRKVANGSNSAYCYFNCTGAGKEVTLSNSSSTVANYFYIKILPVVSGIPYLLYSQKSATPLCVGQYTNNPNIKILMAAKDNNGSILGAGWDLIAANTPGYFAIQSNDYLAQDNPNDWMSIFYYVLEASSGNKIRYAKRVKDNAQQEFLLSPLANFTLNYITFDLDNGTITSASDLIVKKDFTNDEDYELAKNIELVGNGVETSLFSEQQGRLNLKITRPTTYKIRRPQAVANKTVILEDDKPLVQYTTTTQNINRQVKYSTIVEMKANSLLRLTARFKRFNISVPFVMSATYNDRTVKIRGKWKGTTIADPQKNSPTIETRFYDLETGEQL